MKINEVMAEASVDRKQFGKETVRANQKTNIARSAAFRAQMDAPSATPAAAATPAATPAAKPNYGAGGAGMPNTQATPVQKLPAATPAKPGAATPNYGGPQTKATPVSKVTGKAAPGVGGATTDQEVTLANPISATPAAPASPGAAKPGAGVAVAAGGNQKDTGTPAVKGKSRFPNLTRIGDGLGMVARGVGGALGSVIKGADDAITKGGGGNRYGSLADIQDTSGQGTPDIPAEPDTTTPTAAVAAPGAVAPAATPAKPGQPVAATPVTTGQPAKGATPDLGAKPAAAGQPGKVGQPVATPDQDVTLANPIGKAGAAKPGQPQTQDSPVAEPAAAKPGAAKPAAVSTPAAAKGKAMSKQEILAWISRNDEDNAALQSFKDGITSAEKSGAGAAPAAAPAAAPTTPNYSKGTPGVQNIQAAPGKVSYAPKTAATPAATPNYAPKGVPTATPKQPQMASKQYKKAPL